jgi:hypothetical protein
MPTADTVLHCEECGVMWHDPAKRSRAEWVDDDDLKFWCPFCWLVEFGRD